MTLHERADLNLLVYSNCDHSTHREEFSLKLTLTLYIQRRVKFEVDSDHSTFREGLNLKSTLTTLHSEKKFSLVTLHTEEKRLTEVWCDHYTQNKAEVSCDTQKTADVWCDDSTQKDTFKFDMTTKYREELS